MDAALVLLGHSISFHKLFWKACFLLLPPKIEGTLTWTEAGAFASFPRESPTLLFPEVGIVHLACLSGPYWSTHSDLFYSLSSSRQELATNHMLQVEWAEFSQ